MLWRDTAYKGYGYDLKKKKKKLNTMLCIYTVIWNQAQRNLSDIFFPRL